MLQAIFIVLAGAIFALPACAQQPTQAASQIASPTFEVAAIKIHRGDSGDHNVRQSTNRLSIENFTLKELIRFAYELKSDSQIIGGPEWIDKQAFDISAKIDDVEIAKMQQMKPKDRRKQYKLLLQSLLADRFQLRARQAQRVMSVYALVVAKSGPKLARAEKSGQGYHISTRNNHMVAIATSMDDFADQLTGMSESGNRVVLNRTGLIGDYDFKLDWTPDYGGGMPSDSTYPGLFTALAEQLGLKLESQKGAVNVVIIEGAAKPVLD